MVTLIGSDEKEKEKEKLMFENTRGNLSAVRHFLIKLRGVSSIVPEEKRERGGEKIKNIYIFFLKYQSKNNRRF